MICLPLIRDLFWVFFIVDGWIAGDLSVLFGIALVCYFVSTCLLVFMFDLICCLEFA